MWIVVCAEVMPFEDIVSTILLPIVGCSTLYISFVSKPYETNETENQRGLKNLNLTLSVDIST